MIYKLFNLAYQFIIDNGKVISGVYIILTMLFFICVFIKVPFNKYLEFATKHKHIVRYKISFLIFIIVLLLLGIIPEVDFEPSIYRTGDTVTIHTADSTVVRYNYNAVKDFSVKPNALSEYDSGGYLLQFGHTYVYYGSSPSYREYTVELLFYNDSSVKFNVYSNYREELYTALYRPSLLTQYTKKSEPSALVKFLTNDKYFAVIVLASYSLVLLTFIYSMLEYIMSCIVAGSSKTFD